MNKLYRLVRYDLPLHFVLVITNFFPDSVIFLRLRGALASPFFQACAGNLRLGRSLTFYNPSNIRIGKDVYIAYGCWFMAGGAIIVVEDEVLFGPYCVVTTSTHTRLQGAFRHGIPTTSNVKIGRGSWIASHVTVASGVEIGAGALVAAASVVTSNVSSDSMVGGAPARFIRELSDI